jgi:Lon-like ATP-dependent protease
VHDPIYQGAGAFGTGGIPEPKEGAVSKAHGGVLFLDEIGELHQCQMNKLLKVLEDRKVIFESAYYSESNKNIPLYIHDIFKNGIPADFRLIGATTRRPEEIPEAVRSRCVEVFFNPLTEADLEKIIINASNRLSLPIDDRAIHMIAKYTKNGRDAVKILQMTKNVVFLEERSRITVEDAAWALHSCHYLNEAFSDGSGKIIDVSIIRTPDKT